MIIIKTADELKLLRKKFIEAKKDVGFVPTMGALHSGHKSLFQKSLVENDVTIVSIFVNSTQFNDRSDYANYPINIEKDVEILEQSGVDVLFLPNYEVIYPDNYNYRINEYLFSKTLCGRTREGHFEGVLTVVMKLLNIVNPKRAYFGEKDYQQYLLIKNMCQSFFLDVDIIKCPTVREVDGLAMSSRNLLLTKQERETAPHFYKILSQPYTIKKTEEELVNFGFIIDYIEDLHNRRFGAVYLGKVRLIDNVKL
ncbi:MAG: pantoate--beta-alanine ligase [Ignavibacteria bacterium]|nr:MAG: pantoate--beta-alanine ligase [Ignavibacteria bacterium]KAF0160887.1 MAG: pantoate--beta-alanine ligase [Ignavibacteria bacterium]